MFCIQDYCWLQSTDAVCYCSEEHMICRNFCVAVPKEVLLCNLSGVNHGEHRNVEKPKRDEWLFVITGSRASNAVRSVSSARHRGQYVLTQSWPVVSSRIHWTNYLGSDAWNHSAFFHDGTEGRLSNCIASQLANVPTRQMVNSP